MSQQQVKQESVDLLENDEDDIRSIAGSEWTMDTSATNGGGIETMQTLKLKMRILEESVGRIKSEQKCAVLEANQSNSAIVAKLEDAERKAQLAAKNEVAKAMEQLDARFLDKSFRQTIQTMQQTINELAKENAEFKAKTAEEYNVILDKLKAAEEKPHLELHELNSTIQTMQQKMDELVKENAYLKKQQSFYVPLVKVLNPKENSWISTPFDQIWHNFYAVKGFAISGENLRTENFIGKIVYYFEVQCYSNTTYHIGFSARYLDKFTLIGGSPNSYQCFISYKYYGNGSGYGEYPTLGCGLLLDSKNNVYTFSTFDGALQRKPTPISPTVDLLNPTVTISNSRDMNSCTNFGEKPFKFDVATLLLGLELELE